MYANAYTPRKTSTLPEILLLVLSIALLLTSIAAAFLLPSLEFAPVSGSVVHLSSHPASYPATAGTPTVFCVSIQPHDSHSVVTWYVSPATYASYTLGDTVRKGEIRAMPWE